MLNALSNYRLSLLDTDARIISEDGDDIVVAVRISKATILNNAAFLDALADRATVGRTPRDGIGAKVAAAASVARRALFHPASLALNWLITLYVIVTKVI